MTQCKEGSQREGLMLDSAEELYKWFTQQVRKDCLCTVGGLVLHVLVLYCWESFLHWFYEKNCF